MNTFKYISIADLNNLILRKLSTFPRNFDIIVGLPESGLIPANLLALYLNRPFTDLNSFLNGHIYKPGERGSFIGNLEYRRVLVIDDVIREGTTLMKARESLASMSDRFEFSFAVVYIKAGNEDKVDFFLSHLEEPTYTQWHMLRDGIREKMVFTSHKSPVYVSDPAYPFLFSPTTGQAISTYKKTGLPVLSLSDFTLVDSVDNIWSDLRSGKFLPGIKHTVITLRNLFKRIAKKLK